MEGAQRRLSQLASHLGGSSSEEVVAGGMERQHTSAASQSVWDAVPQAPEDPILGVTVAYNKDSDSHKLNLGVGAYRTEEGKPLVLNVVRKVEQHLVNDRSRNKEYMPIAGLAAFNKLTAQLMLGADSPALREGLVVTMQCLSGTGSLRVGAEFLRGFHRNPVVYLPDPTWGNHKKIFPAAGCQIRSYRYYDPKTRGVDFHGMCEDIKNAPDGSVILLHACAHNPTGADPTLDQWRTLCDVIQTKRHLPFFDSAYQGFATGDLDKDAAAVRLFVASGQELLLAQSYAKNMGLYGERIGALSLVCSNSKAASLAESQLKQVIRQMYSSPPIHGAAIVAAILGDPGLFCEWTVELKGMADRIISMRHQLFDALKAKGTPGDWSHILKQIGMFTFTGLNAQQVQFMRDRFHVYMTGDGRISMAGLSSPTVPHLANAIHAAVTQA
eukprot:jgi/Chlat1/7249/Chrsp58S06902